MANIQITQLPSAGAITGTEAVPIVQNGVTVQTTTGAIAASPAQTQTFLTVNLEPTLANSRYVGVAAGLTISDGGAQGLFQIGTTGALSSLINAGNGIMAKTGSTTLTPRTLQVSGQGVTITNGDGVSGDPTFALTGVAAAIAGLSGFGQLTMLGTGATIRQLAGSSGQITVTDGAGTSGNPTIAIASNPVLPGAAGVVVPSGNTAARAALPTNGTIRYNTDNTNFEFYQNSTWAVFGTGAGSVTNVIGTANQITVTNGTTTPTVSITTNPIIPGTGSLTLPIGSSFARPATPVGGMLRYNSDLGVVEAYTTSGWTTLGTGGGSGGVTAIATGTGLTGGPITTTGTIAIADTAVVAGTYGSSSNIPQIIINAQGQITSATNIAVATGGTVTSVDVSGGTTGLTTSGGPITSSGTITLAGTLAATNGGTAQSTYSAGDILYASATNTLSKLSVSTNGFVLTLAGGLPTWAASTGGVTSFNTSLSGLTPSTATTGAITLAGTLGISSGGTGQTTASAAFNALSPITTTGDLIIGNGTNSATRLGIGSNGYVLTSNGTTAAWQAASGGSSSQANAYAWFIS
tara:strand:- start:5169 stop:6902 length:1734 start_codon:yes stop_codon:yes gene_type:complete